MTIAQHSLESYRERVGAFSATHICQKSSVSKLLELSEIVLEDWRNLSSCYMQKLLESVPKSYTDVLRFCAGNTKY